jgi:hypothetical protein
VAFAIIMSRVIVKLGIKQPSLMFSLLIPPAPPRRHPGQFLSRLVSRRAKSRKLTREFVALMFLEPLLLRGSGFLIHSFLILRFFLPFFLRSCMGRDNPDDYGYSGDSELTRSRISAILRTLT